MTVSVAPDRRVAFEAARDVLDRATTIVITTHVQPDGDGIGSEIALTHHLWAAGKDVTILNPHPTPRKYHFMEPDPPISPYEPELADSLLSAADLLVVMDISVPERLGRIESHVAEHDPPILVIDHHAGVSLIEGTMLRFSDAAATGEIVYQLLTSWDARWTPEITTALYAAIAYDTGGFRYANTSPMTLRIAADLVDLGADAKTVTENLFESLSLSRVRLMALLLSEFRLSQNGRVATAVLPLAKMEEVGAESEDVEGIVEVLRAIEGVEVAVLIKEVNSSATKVSFRSIGPHDVSAFAGRFGGGGHVNASGAFIRSPLDTVVEQVVPAAEAAFDPA